MYVNDRAGTTVGSSGPVGAVAPGRAAESAALPTSRAGDATTSSVSGPARLMSKLSQLRDGNPAQLSQIVTSLASGLRDVAARDSGMGAKMLTALASKLDDIANGGDISLLAPAAGPERRAVSPAAESPAGAQPAEAPPGGAPPRLEASAPPEPDPGKTSRAAAGAATYRNADAPGAEGEARRAALAQVLDELDAALKAAGSQRV